MLLNIHRDILVDVDKVLDSFAKSKHHLDFMIETPAVQPFNRLTLLI